MDTPERNPDTLTVIDPAEHGMAAAARLESQTGGLPLLVTGYGLFLAITPPAIAVNIGRALLIGRRDGDFFVVRAVVKLGTGAASERPTATEEARTFTTGVDGPTIELEPQVESLDAVFVQLERVEVYTGPWRVFGKGMSSLPLVTGASLIDVVDDSTGPFIMTTGLYNRGMIKLNGLYSWRPQPTEFLFAGARLDGENDIAHNDGRVSWYGVTYEVEGITWKQRFYVLPIENAGNDCMTLKVQSPASRAHELFALADAVAADFWVPTGPN